VDEPKADVNEYCSTVRERKTSCGSFRCLPFERTRFVFALFAHHISVCRPPEQFIPPVQEPYAYIIFRASEVKDLAVDEAAQQQPPRRNVHDDPAVLGVS
jgi:hypothetical protein